MWEKEIAGNPVTGDCLGEIKRAHLCRMFMTRDICLTDVIRSRVLSPARRQNNGRQSL